MNIKKKNGQISFYLFGGKVDKEREEEDHETVEKEAKKSRVACLLFRTCLINPTIKNIVGNSLEVHTWKKPFEDDLVAAVSLEDGEVLSVRLEAAELAWITYPNYTHYRFSISFNTITLIVT